MVQFVCNGHKTPIFCKCTNYRKSEAKLQQQRQHSAGKHSRCPSTEVLQTLSCEPMPPLSIPESCSNSQTLQSNNGYGMHRLLFSPLFLMSSVSS